MTNGEDRDQPLELILARNLVSIVSLAAFLVDVEGRIVFYNDAAAEIVGRPFEETGVMTREEWSARYGPLDEHGAPIAPDQLPLAVAVREGRPAYACFRLRVERGVEPASATYPITSPHSARTWRPHKRDGYPAADSPAARRC